MKLRARTLALGMVVGAFTGCSVLVGLDQNAVPAVVDAADAAVESSAPPPPAAVACTPMAAGWQLDCSFGRPPGIVFARQAIGPGSIFAYATATGLYLGSTLDVSGLKTVITEYAIDGSVGATQVVFDGGALAVSAANLMGFQAASAITSDDLDAAVQSPEVQVFQSGYTPAPIPFGEVRVDDPREGPSAVGFAIDSPAQAVLGFISANFVVDGSTLPGVATFIGTLDPTMPPHLIGTTYTGQDEPGEAGPDGAPTHPFTPPLLRATVGVPLPLGSGEDFWIGGTTGNDAGAAELFLDADTTPPSLRIPLAFVPETAAPPALGILLGRTDTGIALQELPYPLPTPFDDLAALPAPVVITVPELSTLGSVRAAFNGVDQITAMAMSGRETVLFVQWQLTSFEGGVTRADVAPSTSFGDGGILRVPVPAGTQLGNIAYDEGAYYFTVQLPDRDDVLLRLVNPSGDGGP